MMSTYDAVVSRGESFWLIYVPEIDHWTQARRLSEVDEMARDLIAVMTDTDASAIDLRVHIELPGTAAKHVEQARELRDQAARLKSDAALEWSAAAKELADAGLTVREIGTALDVSFQRAQQLVKASRKDYALASG